MAEKFTNPEMEGERHIYCPVCGEPSTVSRIEMCADGYDALTGWWIWRASITTIHDKDGFTHVRQIWKTKE